MYWILYANTDFQDLNVMEMREHNLSKFYQHIHFRKCGYIMVLFVCFFIFWLCHEARGILVPQTGIEPTAPALEARSLNHWTAREVPSMLYYVSARGGLRTIMVEQAAQLRHLKIGFLTQHCESIKKKR